MGTWSEQKKAATKAAAKERRAKIREFAKLVSDLNDEQREEMVLKVGRVLTIEGHPLTVYNSILITMQDPDATVVGGYRQWKKSGRQVRKGEHAIGMWFPIAKKSKDEDDEEQVDELRFGIANVFDIRQTDEIESENTESEPRHLTLVK